MSSRSTTPDRSSFGARMWARVSPHMTLWLVVIWVILRAEYTLVSLVVGVVLAVVVQMVFPMPRLGLATRIRPLWLVVLAARFVADMAVAAVQVSWLVLRRRPPSSRVVVVPLRSQSAVYLTVATALTSLVPGTVVMDAHLEPATMHLHVLDLPTSGGVDAVARAQLKLEERIMWALAPRDELRARGIERPGRYSPMARGDEPLPRELAPGDYPVTETEEP